jgi:putative MFS transporter
MMLLVVGTAMAAVGLLPTAARRAPMAEAPTEAWATRDEGQRLGRAHWQLMGTLALALVIDVMKPATVGFVMPGVAADYGLSRASIALLPFSALTGTTVGSLLWGIFADKAGRRAAILLSAIMFIGTSVCGAMTSFAGNLVMCFLMGASAGGMLPIAYTLLAETIPTRHRGGCLVLLGGLGLGGGYLAASVAATLLEPHFGWRALFLLGLPTGLVLLALNRFIPESPRFLLLRGQTEAARAIARRFANAGGPAREVAASKGHEVPPPAREERPRRAMLMTLNLAALVWGLINFGLLLWLPSDLRAAGLSAQAADRLLAHSAVLVLPTVFLTAWLYHRWSTKGTLVLLSVMTVAGLAGLALLNLGVPLLGSSLTLLVAVVMIGSGGVIAVLLPYTAEIYPASVRGRATGLIAGSSKFGGILAQCLGIAAVVPSMTVACLALAVPVAVSALMVGHYGLETRGRRL